MDLNAAPEQLGAAAAMTWAWAVTFLPRLAAALALVIAGVFLSRWISRLVRRLVETSRHLDNTIEPILATAARYAVLILFLIAALGQIGVQTASLLAVLGAAGLAIGLALQGTLQNIAAGIMLIYLRPFRVGDAIETPSVSGTVREIGLFATHLDTGDGLFFFVPNSDIWNKPLKNFSRNPHRQFTVQIGIGYDADPAAARRTLLDLAASDPRILKNPPPAVFVDKYADTAVLLTMQAWTSTPDFAEAQRSMAEQAKLRLQAAGINLPLPQRIVRVVSERDDRDAPPSGAADPGA